MNMYRFYRSTGEIAEVRVRRGWFGLAILEVRFFQVSRVCPWHREEPAGLTEWRMANMNDPAEVAAVVAHLGKCNRHI